MSVVVACPLRRHDMMYVAAVCRRFFDRLLLLRRSFKDATKNRGHAPCRGHSPCATRQGLLRYRSSDPDPARPFGLYHLLHLERRPAGSREEVLCAASSSARALLFEADKNRRVVDSDLLRIFAEAAISQFRWLAFISEKSSTRKSSSRQDHSCLKQPSTTCSFGATFPPRAHPENLQELWPDQPSTALYTDASGTTGWGSVLQLSHEATRSSAGW
jgi:hypothetical protein